MCIKKSLLLYIPVFFPEYQNKYTINGQQSGRTVADIIDNVFDINFRTDVINIALHYYVYTYDCHCIIIIVLSNYVSVTVCILLLYFYGSHRFAMRLQNCESAPSSSSAVVSGYSGRTRHALIICSG